MLAESLVYALSLPRTPRGFRRHLPEAVGLWSRGRRQRRAWAPHLAQVRGLIEARIGTLARRRTVAVLGSGPLFDVPLEALARSFRSVLLVDQAHLWTTQRHTGRHANVHQLWHDLSPASNPRHLGVLAGVADLDWVISLNLLSQLALGAPEGSEGFVVDAHLAGLGTLPCPALLISDFCYRVYDRADTERERFDLLHGRTMPRFDQRWSWEVAPLGEEGRDRRRVHSVGAWFDWREAAAGTAEAVSRPAGELGFIRADDVSKLRRTDPVAQQDRAQDS